MWYHTINFNIVTEWIWPKFEWNLTTFHYVPGCFHYVSVMAFSWNFLMICVWIIPSYHIAAFIKKWHYYRVTVHFPPIFNLHIWGVCKASHMFSQFSGGLLLPEHSCNNLPVRWSAIIRYACSPFIPVSIYVIYLSSYFCIINPQFGLIPYFTFSASLIVVPCPAEVILILQVNHT